MKSGDHLPYVMRQHSILQYQDVITMNSKDSTPIISVRCTDDMRDVLAYLSDRLMLNTSSVVRLSLANLYEAERQKEGRL